jgi:dCMP deaminase
MEPKCEFCPLYDKFRCKTPEQAAGCSHYRKDEEVTRQERWDKQYMQIARNWAELKSKDPSTKVGAIVVDQYNNIVGMGYNGFPKGVLDLEERYNDRQTKYQFVVHAEANAIITGGHQCRGATLYNWPLFSCNECAKLVIQSGIVRVVSPKPNEERWLSSYDVALKMYEEAGVKVTFYNV